MKPKMRRLLELNLGEDGFHHAFGRRCRDRAQTSAGEHGSSRSDRFEIAGDQRAGISAGNQTAECRVAGGGDDGFWHRGDGGGSDEGRSQRLRAETFFAERNADGDPTRSWMSTPCAKRTARLREALGQRYTHPNIVARSAKMQEVLATVERVAPTNSTVLLGGESGVGKDLIARAIHEKSRRLRDRSSKSTARRFQKIFWRANCSAMKKAHSPARTPASRANLSWPTKERFSSMRSATCRRRLR